MKKKRSTTAKGHAAMDMAKRIFAARRALVETAPNVVLWIPDPKHFGKRMPISRRHDFWGVWDAIVVEEDPERRHTYFVQVTAVGDMGRRRHKILDSHFPCTVGDLLMGYRGRGVFRVLRGPLFEGQGEEWRVPPPVKKTPDVGQSPEEEYLDDVAVSVLDEEEDW